MSYCRCCGADLSREGHDRHCENAPDDTCRCDECADCGQPMCRCVCEDEWEEEWEEDDGLPFDDEGPDDDGGPDFDPYAGGVIFDEGGEDE